MYMLINKVILYASVKIMSWNGDGDDRQGPSFFHLLMGGAVRRSPPGSRPTTPMEEGHLLCHGVTRCSQGTGR